MNYLPFLFLPFFFFFDTSINEHPIAYVRSIKKSMKPAFFLNLIPDFFSLFFNKNSSRYIYIYIFIHSRLSFHLDFAITPLPFITRSQRLFLGQNGIPQKWGAGREGGQQFLHYTAPKSPYLRKSGLVSLDFPPQFCLSCEWRETIAADFASNYCGYSNPDRWRVLREPLDLRGFAEGRCQLDVPICHWPSSSHLFHAIFPYIFVTPCEKLV